MARGRALILPLAVSLLLVACGSGSATDQGNPPQRPDLSNAIALSVLSDAVYLVDADTGAITVVAKDLADFRGGYAAWAPDHLGLAFGDGGIFLRALASEPAQRTLIGGDSYSMPSWSPAGNELVYGNGAAFWVTPSDALQPTQLHVPATLAPLDMDWGFDGIAFEGLRRDCQISYRCPTTDESDIWTIAPDSTDLRRLTYLLHAVGPKWSPDGSTILFVLRTGPLSGQLWTIGPGGENPQRLGRLDDVLAADWSPDGSSVAMVRPADEVGRLQLWVARSDGAGARAVGASVPGRSATVDW
jgi:dipeptidyl aminopeptidase/acylaminoacyl peptidase